MNAPTITATVRAVPARGKDGSRFATRFVCMVADDASAVGLKLSAPRGWRDGAIAGDTARVLCSRVGSDTAAPYLRFRGDAC